MSTSLLWFRRDLRLADHPALMAAASEGPVVALFVLDPALRNTSGKARLAFLLASLRSLDTDLRTHGGSLIVRVGKPESVVPEMVRESRAKSVHISADFAPYGAARDTRVAEALGSVPLVRTGSPYAVAPGRVTKSDGEPYKVFSAFYRAWCAHGWRAPAGSDPSAVDWVVADGDGVPEAPVVHIALPEAGEQAAHRTWQKFLGSHLARYPDERDRPDLDHTSRLSPYLKFGAIHPRTLLADLTPDDETFTKELAWREFYAAVLHFWPASGRGYFQPRMASMAYETGPDADEMFEAWASGHTGYPIVDAGMRQLLGEGWMHNRVRMITASFLVKDLHLEWTRGARHFMRHLIDGDLASNQHGWQWVAGTGTDAAPYFRIFNPVTQGKKFDPAGDYIRRWVPELSALRDREIHEPWRRAAGAPSGYPPPIVEHAHERLEALSRYKSATSDLK